jgi:glycosyltransferase involved in cell wall biosynthesis
VHGTKVVHVITGLDVGGAERMLVSLAGREAATGTAPTVVSLTPGGALAGQLVRSGVPVVDLGMPRGRPTLAGLFRLAGLIRRERPAAVLGWMYHANLLATVALALSGRRRRTALYWGIRCSDMDLSTYGRMLRMVVGASAKLSARPDAIVYNSEEGVAAHRALGFHPRRTLLIDNGIDTARFRPAPAVRVRLRAELGIDGDRTVIAVTARVDPMKDFPTLLAALERVPDSLAILMGQGTDTDLPPRPGVLALGRRDDVPDVLSAADIIVSSSAFGEGFSNALAEGMACGLLPVATDVGDAKRIVGDTGYIVPPRDPAALAGAIAAAMALPDRTAKGAAARRRIEERFSFDRAAERFRKLYADGLAGEEYRP